MCVCVWFSGLVRMVECFQRKTTATLLYYILYIYIIYIYYIYIHIHICLCIYIHTYIHHMHTPTHTHTHTHVCIHLCHSEQKRREAEKTRVAMPRTPSNSKYCSRATACLAGLVSPTVTSRDSFQEWCVSFQEWCVSAGREQQTVVRYYLIRSLLACY